MKKCPVCDSNIIDDKYIMCLSCSQKSKESKPAVDVAKLLSDVSEQLKFINWNLGVLAAVALQDKAAIKKIKDDREKRKHDNQKL